LNVYKLGRLEEAEKIALHVYYEWESNEAELPTKDWVLRGRPLARYGAEEEQNKEDEYEDLLLDADPFAGE